MKVKQFPDRQITFKERSYLYFGGTSYLGIAANKEFQNILSEEIKNWGTFYGTSRNSNVQLSVYEEFEKHFAELIEAENCLSVSSGTIAGQLVLNQLSCEENTFFHYPKTHPAILEKNSFPLFLEKELHPKIFDCNNIVITVDAVLAGEVSPTNFKFLNDLPKKVTLVIDESHSLGVLGKNGNGIFSSIHHPKIKRKIMVSSLGKALGLAGGVIASDTAFIAKMKQNFMFVSSSGMNPAYLATFLKTDTIYSQQKEKLKHNLLFLAKNLQLKKYTFNPNYPVLYVEDETIYTQLLKQGIIITSFKYPTYKNKVNRIVINANHTIKDLEKLIKTL